MLPRRGRRAARSAPGPRAQLGKAREVAEGVAEAEAREEQFELRPSFTLGAVAHRRGEHDAPIATDGVEDPARHLLDVARVGAQGDLRRALDLASTKSSA